MTTIKTIAAPVYPTAYINGDVHHQGRVYRVESAEPIGDRGWQLTTRSAATEPIRLFFVDTKGNVRS